MSDEKVILIPNRDDVHNDYSSIIPAEYDDHESFLHQINGDEKQSSSFVEETNHHNKKSINNDNRNLYIVLILTNKPYRLFLISYMISRAGDWFTYVATISCIERFGDYSDGGGVEKTTSKTAVSILVVVRLIPIALMAGLGGTLSDTYDRRKCMILLDLLCAAVALLFLIAFYTKSTRLFYIVSFLQGCLSGLYEPCREAILPLMVPNHDFLKKATTLVELVWSAMYAFGSASGGLAVVAFGLPACFVIDSVSYVISSIFMSRIGGNWNGSVAIMAENSSITGISSLVSYIRSKTFDGMQYLKESKLIPFVLIKGTGACLYGAADVLNVAFAEEGRHYNIKNGNNEEVTDIRIGILFAFCGIGCLLGPFVVEGFTTMKCSMTLLRAIVWAFGFVVTGYAGLSVFKPFYAICIFSIVRAAGSSILWINGTLLLQKHCRPEMLGRVFAVDYGLATVCDASSSILTGLLLDRSSLSARGVSTIMLILSIITYLGWLSFYFRSIEEESVAASSSISISREPLSKDEQITESAINT